MPMVETMTGNHDAESITALSGEYGILIADDHPLFREALVGRLRRLIANATILEVADLPQLQTQLLERDDIDLVLLDLNMPGAHGLSALVHARALAPSVAVVVVSALEDTAIMHRATALGAAGYIPKSADLQQVISVLSTVLSGGIVPPPAMDEAMVSSDEATLTDAESDAARRIGQLTPQQFRIATLLAVGKLNKQIASELGITEATVKVHMSTILRKLGVQNRTQVALLVQLLGFETSGPETVIPDISDRRP